MESFVWQDINQRKTGLLSFIFQLKMHFKYYNLCQVLIHYCYEKNNQEAIDKNGL
jgi:gamma-glutamylcysteine synthetase